MSPRVCVVVITCNGRKHLERLLPSLKLLNPDIDQIVLVDNASSDGSSEFVAANYPAVQILRHPENFGFAKGNNVAIRHAVEREFEYVLLLNDDTVIVDPTWIDKGVSAAKVDPRIGIVGFRLAASPQPQNELSLEFHPVDRVEGWCMLVKTELFRKIGLFDETYFAYGEESDFEARAEYAGYRFVEINASVFHLGGGSFGAQPANRVYLRARNWLRYVLKVEPPRMIPYRMFQILAIHFLPARFAPPRIRLSVEKHSAGSWLLTLSLLIRAVVWNVWHLPETLRARKQGLARARGARPDSAGGTV